LEEKPQTQVSSESLKDIIERQAENYCTEEEATNVLEKVIQKVECHTYPVEFEELYEVQHSFDKHHSDSLPQESVIGKWLDEHSHNYFAEVEDEEVEVPVSSYLPFFERRFLRPRFRRQVTGFELTANGPYEIIQIQAKARFPNISWSACIIVALLSKMNIRLFYFYADYIEKNWKDRKLPRRVNWQTTELRLQDVEDICHIVENIQREFVEWCVNKLRKAFGLSEDEIGSNSNT